MTTTTHPTINTIMFDCHDPQRLAAFWTDLLGVEIRAQFAGYIWLEPQRPGGPSLAFQPVPDPTPGKNRLHLDGAFDDLEAVRGRIEALGGSHVSRESVPGFVWDVFSDPEGNVFCLGHED